MGLFSLKLLDNTLTVYFNNDKANVAKKSKNKYGDTLIYIKQQ